jgi:tRNA A-37 threonylcarbamoyl transferase component Bud32
MIGDRLGKWVIFKELGRGGMGSVYLAQEELTGKQVALKVLAPALAQDIGFLQRFQREIETLSKLDHPNIVRFYEAGFENGHYFYAMEYVEGVNLEQILEKQNRFPWRDVLDIALQVTPALRHVHDHGIIHRDIKPSNLIRNAKGQIKLTDFGIAKVFAATHLTATDGIVGTAEFLSPEQAAGKVVGKRSDLYCLGCVLYVLLTGRTPFTGTSYVELLHKHRYGQFDRPHKYVPDLPPEFEELVCQLLEKDPDKRPRDALVFYKQLDSISRKLARKGYKTSADIQHLSTLAENRADSFRTEALPGPATLMSRLVRAELDAHQLGGVLSRFFNRPAILLLVLLACIGILTWKFWPLNQDELYQRGAKLMESDSLYDMKQAWTEYLEPLERDYPDHAYKEEVAAFRLKWEAAKAPHPSEAQLFFQQGELLHKQGNPAAARQVWRSLIDVFADVDAEKEWVNRARRALSDLEKAALNTDRWKNVRTALERAKELQQQGKLDDAERIWRGIQELYRNDPAATNILLEIERARQKK